MFFRLQIYSGKCSILLALASRFYFAQSSYQLLAFAAKVSFYLSTASIYISSGFFDYFFASIFLFDYFYIFLGLKSICFELLFNCSSNSASFFSKSILNSSRVLVILISVQLSLGLNSSLSSLLSLKLTILLIFYALTFYNFKIFYYNFQILACSFAIASYDIPLSSILLGLASYLFRPDSYFLKIFNYYSQKDIFFDIFVLCSSNVQTSPNSALNMDLT